MRCFARKAKEEQTCARASPGKSNAKEIGDPWADIEKAMTVERGLFQPYVYLEAGAGFQGRLAGFARALVRGAAEREKPNDQRFREFHRRRVTRIEQQLGASIPILPGARTAR